VELAQAVDTRGDGKCFNITTRTSNVYSQKHRQCFSDYLFIHTRDYTQTIEAKFASDLQLFTRLIRRLTTRPLSSAVRWKSSLYQAGKRLHSCCPLDGVPHALAICFSLGRIERRVFTSLTYYVI
jgi:hypothetical protein